MQSKMNLVHLFAVAVLSFASAGEEGDVALSLSEFQGVLRSSLDSELEKIADGSHRRDVPDQRSLHKKARSNIRRRATVQEDVVESSASSVSTEDMWDDLVQHAWNSAGAIKRGEDGGLQVTKNHREVHPSPFLVCIRGQGSDGVQSVLLAFDKQDHESLVVSTSHDETCLILTTTALQARKVMVMHNPEGSQALVAMPLLDVSKIHAGTIDEVSSRGWSVPYHEEQDQVQDSASSMKNETEAMNEWERMIVVDFVPGLGGMKEESELLEVVNKMMGDIQDMGEVGWLRSMGKEQAEEFLIDESLVGVPALSDMFSLTSSLRQEDGVSNSRIKFWQDSLRNGIESEHACSEMFSTLFVKPRAGYYSYDLVLNPVDGPPPGEEESSAANPACVTSLLAALSTHPYVLSVKANFPMYHGWNIAQKLDSF